MNPSNPATTGTSTTTTPATACNLRDGANKTNQRRPPDPYVEQPYRWSQRWFDDPPVGTTVTLGNGKVEVYAGNEEWHSVGGDALN